MKIGMSDPHQQTVVIAGVSSGIGFATSKAVEETH
jgi:NADP-dependent 3-hydroxy acid dehydrogenase YdfG